ncbi:hypothetical protein KAW50_03980 [candidate division WOR-3 bacterium]|nr:hypothetical protein [candidate division WOR-3 bacterium]
MNEIEIELKIGKVLGGKLEDFLLLEKKRRGIDKDKLVFIGMANIAKYYWCAMKSLFESRELELAFFGSYLYDRLLYSFRLRLIDKLPKNKEKLLEIGNEITFNDIEKLLKRKDKLIHPEKLRDTDKSRRDKKISEKKLLEMSVELAFSEEFLEEGEKIGLHYLWDSAVITTDKDDNNIIVINPDIPPEERELFEDTAKSKGIRVANVEEFPILRGKFFHTTKAEKYPTIRWNFDWNGYAVVGVPDGITNSFVYEFKTTGNKHLMYFQKPVAFTQADLYGYFFKRDTKRVQIYIVDKMVTETWEEAIDVNHALEILDRFKSMDEGNAPLPPKEWKCKNCKFKKACKLWKK